VLRNNVLEPDGRVVVGVVQPLSDAALQTTGTLLLALVAVAFGGTFVLRVARGGVPATALQQRFYRAGHAHAGVLVVLAIVVQPYADAVDLAGGLGVLARSGVGAAAILMPAGFFLAVVGSDVERPNRLLALVWVGGAVLTASVVTLGLALLLR
jgi:hypothetical protein